MPPRVRHATIGRTEPSHQEAHMSSTEIQQQTTAVPAGTWAVDPTHTVVGFSVRHAGITNVRGRFHEFEGRLVVAEDGSVSAGGTVQVASVDTGVGMRDEDLRGPNYFDAETYPQITFRATSADLSDPEEIRIAGGLTMHGVTRDIVLTGEVLGTEVDDEGYTRVGLTLATRISRAEWGMRFSAVLGSGNVLVGDKVTLTLEVSAVKEA